MGENFSREIGASTWSNVRIKILNNFKFKNYKKICRIPSMESRPCDGGRKGLRGAVERAGGRGLTRSAEASKLIEKY